MQFETPARTISFLYQDTIQDSRLIRIHFHAKSSNPFKNIAISYPLANGPGGRQLIMPPNERPVEPLFRLDLSRLWGDVCANSYIDFTCFGIFRCVHCARVMFSM